ncbi:MAG: molybdopterin guanine dinucleotide-containing S/N-oxide reductase [Sulfurospirillum sp.]
MSKDTKIMSSRRTFMKMAAATGVATCLESSAFGTRFPSGSVMDKKTVATGTHWGPIEAEVTGGVLTGVKPASADMWPTPMISALVDRVYAKDRIKYPMVREGFLKHGHKSDKSMRGKDKFVRVSWEKAIELAANELKRVKKSYGNEALYAGRTGWRSVGRLNSAPITLRRMLNLFGGYSENTGNPSIGCIMRIAPHVSGDMEAKSRQTAWPTILEHTDTVVLLGANLLKNNQIDHHPIAHYSLNAVKELKAKNKKIISIDPRKSDVTEYLNADWLAIRPNTDVALMLGVAYTLYKENLYDKAFLDKYTVGFDKFLPYLLGKSDGVPKTPEWASKITTIDAQTIKDLAKQMASGRTMIMSGWSVQRGDHGEQPIWMVITLAAMLGQIGLPGGGYGFSYHRASGGSPKADAPSLPGLSAGKNPVKSHIPTFHGLSEALLNPGKIIDYDGKKVKFPNIKLMWWAAGNPMSDQQDRNKQIKSWRKLETVIINEMFWTQTAKFADIVFPITTTFERNDIDFLGTSKGDFFAMKKVIEPLYEAKSDYEVFTEVAKKLGFEKKYTEGRSEMDWIKHFYSIAQKQAKFKKISMPSFDEFWEKGVVAFPVSEKSKKWVMHSKFRANPLGTPSGKFEIYSNTIEKFKYDDCPPHPTWLEPVEWLGDKEQTKEYPFHMVSPHPQYRLHTMLDNTWLRRLYEVKQREPMWINPKDAKRIGIKDGDVVMVHNARGKLLAGAVVTDKIREHVIMIQEGVRYDPDKPGEIGAMCKHGNPNLVTSDKGTSKLAQSIITNTVLVNVSKYTEPLPKITAFDVPEGA